MPRSGPIGPQIGDASANESVGGLFTVLIGNEKADVVGEQNPQVESVPERSGPILKDVALCGLLTQRLWQLAEKLPR